MLAVRRRGFLGRLFGLAAVAALEPLTFLEERFAAVEVPPFECADLETLAAALKRTYSSGYFFEGLDEAPPASGAWNVPLYLAPGGP